MWRSKCETVNPHVRAQGRLWRSSPGMDGVMFPPVPDTSLKGTNAHFPIHPDSSSPESILPKRNTSFLWNKNIQDTTDLEGSFDHDTFFHMHKHLLGESDHSTELEKSLYDRRKGIAGTYSTIESKSHSEFTSAQDINLYAGMTTPYDELTYEETLFELHRDRKKLPLNSKVGSSLPLTSEEETTLQTFLKNRKTMMEGRIAAKHEPRKARSDIIGLKSFREDKNCSKKGGIPRRNLSLTSSGMDRLRVNTRSESFRRARHGQHHQPETEDSYDSILSERLIKSYIEERIKEVEKQIRQEVAEEANMMKQHSRPAPKVPFPDMSSANVPVATTDTSSKEFILREIAAVLAAKGYLPEAQPQQEGGLPRHTDSPPPRSMPRKLSSDKLGSPLLHRHGLGASLTKVQRYKNASPRSTPPSPRKSSLNSTSSTYKSHKESNREPIIKSSHNSPSLTKNSLKSQTVSESTDFKRRKRKSPGSRSSLTSLLRTQESSSSDSEVNSSILSRRHSNSSKKTGSATGSITRVASSDGGVTMERTQHISGHDTYAMPSILITDQAITVNKSGTNSLKSSQSSQYSRSNVLPTDSLEVSPEYAQLQEKKILPISPLAQSNSFSEPAATVNGLGERRVPPPRPPAPSAPVPPPRPPLPLHKTKEAQSSSTGSLGNRANIYQQLAAVSTPPTLPKSTLLPNTVPQPGPPPPVPKRPKRIIQKNTLEVSNISAMEGTYRTRAETTRPATTGIAMTRTQEEETTLVNKDGDEMSMIKSGGEMSLPTINEDVKADTVASEEAAATVILNTSLATELSETPDSVDTNNVAPEQEDAKATYAEVDEKLSRDDRPEGTGASRAGSPELCSPARQSLLGYSSATSQPNEDRSETDYFLMDDHTAGTVFSYDDYHFLVCLFIYMSSLVPA
ncbi:putative Serine/arginine repetitive matrix protein 1-like 6 [Homarus americanus]|uniref:Putative Serine/arginine repetitive matrix protein 1-like 6 n=1 Tax=Homarus americanus TaxID=6706 RepID=A0A8J5K5C2_HOMAM|nr:putative Serine/arginine repetitive matrix protein 1-like 6 [Homarus americanus]